MKPVEKVLHHILDGFAVGPERNTLTQRVMQQHLIYLAQLHQISIGYIFTWSVAGPHSDRLTSHLHEMAQAAASGEKPSGKLQARFEKAIRKALPISFPPSPDKLGGVDIPRHIWLEAIVSVHHLRHGADIDPDKMVKLIRTRFMQKRNEKPETINMIIRLVESGKIGNIVEKSLPSHSAHNV